MGYLNKAKKVLSILERDKYVGEDLVTEYSDKMGVTIKTSIQHINELIQLGYIDNPNTRLFIINRDKIKGID